MDGRSQESQPAPLMPSYESNPDLSGQEGIQQLVVPQMDCYIIQDGFSVDGTLQGAGKGVATIEQFMIGNEVFYRIVDIKEGLAQDTTHQNRPNGEDYNPYSKDNVSLVSLVHNNQILPIPTQSHGQFSGNGDNGSSNSQPTPEESQDNYAEKKPPNPTTNTEQGVPDYPNSWLLCQYCKAYVQQGAKHVCKTKTLHRCPRCPQKFHELQKLRQHLSSHMTPHRCQFCHQCYPPDQEEEYQAHLETHQTEQDDSHPCKTCGMEFERPSCLEEHVKANHGGKTEQGATSHTHECYNCEASFSSANALILHHYLMKKGKCAITYPCFCGERFAMDASYKFHLASHERPAKRAKH